MLLFLNPCNWSPAEQLRNTIREKSEKVPFGKIGIMQLPSNVMNIFFDVLSMNMVRTGVVSHPSEWKFCGFNEIQNPRQRYALINNSRLMQLLNIRSIDELKDTHKRWVEETLRIDRHV